MRVNSRENKRFAVDFEKMLSLGKSSKDAWTSQQFELIGVSWPPKKGWRSERRGTDVEEDISAAFIAAKGSVKVRPTKTARFSYCGCGRPKKAKADKCKACGGMTPNMRKKKGKKKSKPAIGLHYKSRAIARRNKKAKTPRLTGKQWYAEVYLKSDWWRERRKLKLDAVGRRCNRCPSIKNLQVHHLSYDRKYGELDADLEVLCKPCHETEHGARRPG